MHVHMEVMMYTLYGVHNTVYTGRQKTSGTRISLKVPWCPVVIGYLGEVDDTVRMLADTTGFARNGWTLCIILCASQPRRVAEQ